MLPLNSVYYCIQWDSNELQSIQCSLPFSLKGKKSRIRAGEGETNGRVWASCWRASCIFRTARHSTVADSYNNQDFFFFTLRYNKIWMNNRETCSPRSLKHCGAITGALNIPARHDAAHRSLNCARLLWGPFCIILRSWLKSAQVQVAGRRRSQNSFLECCRLLIR